MIVQDAIDMLQGIDPALPVCLWSPEWIDAISLKGFDIVDWKVYLHCGWGPQRDDPSPSMAPVEVK